MRTCDQDLLSLYLDGALTLPQQVSLRTHLSACPDCSRELATLERMDQVVASWGEVRTPVPVATNRRVMHSVERSRRLGFIGGVGRMVPAAFGTGIAALLVLVSVNAGILSQSAPTPPPATPPVSSRVFIKQSARLINARRSTAVLGTYAGRAPASTPRRLSMEVN